MYITGRSLFIRRILPGDKDYRILPGDKDYRYFNRPMRLIPEFFSSKVELNFS